MTLNSKQKTKSSEFSSFQENMYNLTIQRICPDVCIKISWLNVYVNYDQTLSKQDEWIIERERRGNYGGFWITRGYN